MSVRLFPSDTLVTDQAYFYRYSIKKLKIDKFPETDIIHRKFNNYDEYLAFIHGNGEGVTISKDENVVSNCNGLYFYVWSNTEIGDKRLNKLFIKAIKKYFEDKINGLETQIDAYKMRLEAAESDLVK